MASDLRLRAMSGHSSNDVTLLMIRYRRSPLSLGGTQGLVKYKRATTVSAVFQYIFFLYALHLRFGCQITCIYTTKANSNQRVVFDLA